MEEIDLKMETTIFKTFLLCQFVDQDHIISFENMGWKLINWLKMSNFILMSKPIVNLSIFLGVPISTLGGTVPITLIEVFDLELVIKCEDRKFSAR